MSYDQLDRGHGDTSIYSVSDFSYVESESEYQGC